MSQIRVRRRRKKNWIDVRKGMSSQKLAGMLVLVILIIWYLGWRF